MESDRTTPTQTPKNRLTISLDLRFVVIGLLVVIAIMLSMWKPWDTTATRSGSDTRTITVTGEASLKAEPDEFVFSPAYTVTNDNREAALAEMTKKSDEVIAKLKGLGVTDSQIKSNADSYNREIMYYPEKPGGSTPGYTLQLTVTLPKRDQAQKVQDYLNTTSPTGSITPGASFSAAKRKQLESKARDEATKDARAKADQSAKNLGFRLGSVKSVKDGNNFGVMPMYERGVATDSAAPSPPANLSVQPGENELNYSVTVEYFVR